ncbi:MAG: hypothetical protein M5R36_17885 [Deltaproteobacteria bacterium]|nr:hypothetical protein [Deltaproteobacteria bacterium]
MAENFADILLTVAFLLGVASFYFSPYHDRTIRGYYGRLILLVLTGLLGIFDGRIVSLSTVIWAPILMATRKHWYPMPGDKTLEDEADL